MRRLTAHRTKRTIKKLFNSTKSFAKEDFSIFIRLSLLSIVFLSLGILSGYYFIEQNSSPNKIVYKEVLGQTQKLSVKEQLVTNTELPTPLREDIDTAVGIKIEQEEIKKEQERLRRERQIKIDRLAGYLGKVKSPMADYANIIVEKAESCGADYKIIVAIAGNESGYGRIAYKEYNPYGYLNKVQYTGWDTSLSDLTCKVAKYTNKYSDIYTLGKAYGAHNPEQWAKNINWHLSQIP
ncbi:glucosaminidase domain-containing protein [Candidatus Dojkabacteria bacterium]|nr:glucosaminidase domain-containing protein [Candidatus Dojkabacteria bacterium]